jgi:hypothetical protein
MSKFASSEMITQNVKEKLSPRRMITSSQMITPKMQAYAIIQPDSNINFMIIWLGDSITIVTLHYM